jgi:hypothetical protein
MERETTAAQAFRPANGRAGSPEGLRYVDFATRSSYEVITSSGGMT